MLFGLLSGRFHPSLVLSITAVFFFFTGLVSFAELISSYLNKTVLTIMFLFIVGNCMASNNWFVRWCSLWLNNQKYQSIAVLRLMTQVAIVSGFVNNTPVVAMFIPTIQKMRTKITIVPSKVLIPISYAAIIGGTTTLLGTSTNLILHSMLIEKGYDGFGIFEFAWIGVPLTITGILYISFIGIHFLPFHSNTQKTKILDESSPDYRKKKRLRWLFPVMFAGFIVLTSTQTTSIFIAAFLFTSLLFGTKSLTLTEAKNYIDWKVILLIGSAMALGKVIKNISLDVFISQLLIEWYSFGGLFLTLILCYLITNLLTEFTHNIAAAVMMFPVGVSLAENVGVDPKLFIIN
ncbi:MAG: SLC13 family permease, partial [Halobacillus sp.]|uniref:SLC13 family permease n=1 Tax=Halobacillus sp. TaxID=56800 RepID=UPI003BB14426